MSWVGGRRDYWPERDRQRLAELLDLGWSDVRIARDLGRAVSTIRKARMRFGMAPRYRRGHTAREVSRLLGVNHMVPQRWIDSGRLSARRNKARYGRHACLMVDHFDLCEFLADPDNWHCYDPSTITDPALRAWLTRLRGDVRFISVKEAARRLGIVYTAVRARAEKRGIELPKDGGIVWVRESDLEVLRRPVNPVPDGVWRRLSVTGAPAVWRSVRVLRGGA